MPYHRFFYMLCLIMVISIIDVRAQSSVNITFGEHIEELLTHHISRAREITYLPGGYRIQILATTDRMKMQEVRRDLEIKYQKRYPIHWTHEQPWYKLQVGAFASQLEAQHLLHILKEEFPGAYLSEAKDITPEELLDNL